MTRTSRRTLAFESMEGRVLLSTGMAHPGAHPFAHAHAHPAARHAKVQVGHVMLNGYLRGIPTGAVGQDGIVVSSFAMKGKTQSLGRVTASLALSDTLIAPGKQPDLSNATLTLGNPRGSVQIKMASSPSNRSIFIVMSGTGAYSSAYGSGVAVIWYNQRLHQYQIGLRSAAH